VHCCIARNEGIVLEQGGAHRARACRRGTACAAGAHPHGMFTACSTHRCPRSLWHLSVQRCFISGQTAWQPSWQLSRSRRVVGPAARYSTACQTRSRCVPEHAHVLLMSFAGTPEQRCAHGDCISVHVRLRCSVRACRRTCGCADKGCGPTVVPSQLSHVICMPCVMMTRRMPRVCKGLSGLQTGRQLLHSAIDMLHKTHPKRRLATLSPIPGFRRWLRNRLAQTHSAATLRLHERPGRQMLVERLLMSEVEMASGASVAPASLQPCAVLGSGYGVCRPSLHLTHALHRHTSSSVMHPIGRMRDLFAD
jgi:Malonyl-CoA decarboxylase C-terminal domain